MEPVSLGRILVVEDDEGVRRSLELALGDEGYTVEAVDTSLAALERFERFEPDLVLIDVMLPRSSGLDLCRELRHQSHVPIIMVTARDDSHDVVAGLEAGADDYVTKPFVFKELAARIRALLRRARVEVVEDAEEPADFGWLRIAVDEGRVWVDGDEISLTRTEFLLLAELSRGAGRVMSREHLLAQVWGYDYFGDGRVVDAHVRRLRRKVEPDPSEPVFIVTVRGLGYRFDPGDG